MKIFLFALVLFLLLLGFITFNYIYVNRASRELASKASEIAPDPEAIEVLRALWDEKKTIVGLSIGTSKLDTIKDLLDSLQIYADAGNPTEFERTRVVLINAFEGISEFESLKPEDIF